MNITIRAAIQSDLSSLRPILETWIRDAQTQEIIMPEVESTLKSVRDAISGVGNIRYKVAVADGSVIGMVGVSSVIEPEMLPHAETDFAAELRHFYVGADHRNGRGVGRALFYAAAEEVCRLGFQELLVNSGPRYKDTAWGFYEKMFGKPTAVLKDFYGEGAHAPVWRKKFNNVPVP